VGGKLQRPLVEKQRKLELQLQPEFQHDNACSSSPPPSQQSGGDDLIRQEMVVTKENQVLKSTEGKPSVLPQNEDSWQSMLVGNHAQRQQNILVSTSQSKDLPSPVRSAADACSWREWSSADLAKGQGNNNGWREWSSTGDFAKGQGKPKLRSIRSTSPEDKVNGLLVDPLKSVCVCRSLIVLLPPCPSPVITVGLGRKVN
jgi:hypothetical protein